MFYVIFILLSQFISSLAFDFITDITLSFGHFDSSPCSDTPTCTDINLGCYAGFSNIEKVNCNCGYEVEFTLPTNRDGTEVSKHTITVKQGFNFTDISRFQYSPDDAELSIQAAAGGYNYSGVNRFVYSPTSTRNNQVKIDVLLTESILSHICPTLCLEMNAEADDTIFCNPSCGGARSLVYDSEAYAGCRIGDYGEQNDDCPDYLSLMSRYAISAKLKALNFEQCEENRLIILPDTDLSIFETSQDCTLEVPRIRELGYTCGDSKETGCPILSYFNPTCGSCLKITLNLRTCPSDMLYCPSLPISFYASLYGRPKDFRFNAQYATRYSDVISNAISSRCLATCHRDETDFYCRIDKQVCAYAYAEIDPRLESGPIAEALAATSMHVTVESCYEDCKS